MKISTLIRITFFILSLIYVICPIVLEAIEIDSSLENIEGGEKIEAPSSMSQKEMNDLFGEDPYLGQTSYLQSPEGFIQRENSK